MSDITILGHIVLALLSPQLVTGMLAPDALVLITTSYPPGRERTLVGTQGSYSYQDP